MNLDASQFDYDAKKGGGTRLEAGEHFDLVMSKLTVGTFPKNVQNERKGNIVVSVTLGVDDASDAGGPPRNFHWSFATEAAEGYVVPFDLTAPGSQIVSHVPVRKFLSLSVTVSQFQDFTTLKEALRMLQDPAAYLIDMTPVGSEFAGHILAGGRFLVDSLIPDKLDLAFFRWTTLDFIGKGQIARGPIVVSSRHKVSPAPPATTGRVWGTSVELVLS